MPTTPRSSMRDAATQKVASPLSCEPVREADEQGEPGAYTPGSPYSWDSRADSCRRGSCFRVPAVAGTRALLLLALWLALVFAPFPAVAQDAADTIPELPDADAFPADTAAALAFDNLADQFVVGVGWDRDRLPVDLRATHGWPGGPQQIAFLRQMQAAFASINARSLDTTRFIDHGLASTWIAGQLAEFEQERPDRHDAGWYVPDPAPLIDWARKHRAPDAMKRLDLFVRQIAARLPVARAQLNQPWRRTLRDARKRLTAIRQAVADTMRRLPEEAQSTSRWQQLTEPLDEFRDLLTQREAAATDPSDADTAAQRQRAFRRHVRYDEHIDLSTDELVQMASDEIARLRIRLQDAARAIGPRPWREIVEEMKDDTLPDDDHAVRQFATDTIGRVSAFLREHPIMPLPERMNDLAVIVNRPAPGKSIGPAWYNPMKRNGQRGEIHLGLQTAGTEANRQRLRELHRDRLAVILIHEAIPGHHMQFAVIDGEPTRSAIRRRFWFVSNYIEGWGLYAEQLMAETGFLQRPRERMAMLMMRMWRAVRVLADVGLNTGTMNRDEAETLFRDVAMLEPDSAKQEVQRHLDSPGQRLGYLYGALQLDEMHDELQRRFGSRFSLLDFHHRVLDEGPMPLRLLRARVTGERVGPIDELPHALPGFPREWLASKATNRWHGVADGQWRAPGVAGTNMGVGELRILDADAGTLAVFFPPGTQLPADSPLTVFDDDGVPTGMVSVRTSQPTEQGVWPVALLAVVPDGPILRAGLRVAWGAALPREFVAPASGARVLSVRTDADGTWATVEMPAAGNDASQLVIAPDGRCVARFVPELPLGAAGQMATLGRLLLATPDAVLPAGSVVVPDTPLASATGELKQVERFGQRQPLGPSPLPGLHAIGSALLRGSGPACSAGAVWGVYTTTGERVGTFTISHLQDAAPGTDQPLTAIGLMRAEPGVSPQRLLLDHLRLAWPAIARIPPE